jgi:hypothetical protein
MAHMPVVQKGTEGNQIQEARMDQRANDFLVPALPLYAEHCDYV